MTWDLLDVNAVAPDTVEVVESYRTWKLGDGRLVSHNGSVWKPGEPLHASCRGGSGTQYEVALVRGGASIETIHADITRYNEKQHQFATVYWTGAVGRSTHRASFLDVPTVEPPAGYGYVIQAVPHETPSEHCSCGIYSGMTLDVCPPGDVRGKVKLWGKVIPGEKGYRAEYAYPSEFIVPAALAEDPTLLAFGVPITIDEHPPKPAGAIVSWNFASAGTCATASLPKQRMNPWLRVAIIANLAAAALNLSLVGLHLLT